MHYIPTVFDPSEEQIHVQKGRAVAIQAAQLETRPSYYKHVSQSCPRDFDTALEERIRLPFADGLLTKDGYDDRKLRLDWWGSFWDPQHKHHAVLYIGPALFQESDHYERQFHNDTEHLRQQGKEQFGDDRALTCQIVAAHTLTIADDGVMLFKRSNKVYWPDHYAGIGGLVTADASTIFQGDPLANLQAVCKQTAQAELKEEVGIEASALSFNGFVEAGTTIDGSYCLHTGKSVDESLRNWATAQDKADHMEYKVLRGRQELEVFMASDELRTPQLEGTLQLLLLHGFK